jgi:hypothetical protein
VRCTGYPCWRTRECPGIGHPEFSV